MTLGMHNVGRSARPGERGFTLVEMLVSLIVLALIMGLLASGARLLRGTGDRLADAAAAMAEVTLVAELLQTRLGDAVALEVGPAGQTIAAFDGTAERLRFVSLALVIAPGEPLVAMELAMEPATEADQDEAGGLVLARAELAASEPGFAALDDPARVVRRQLAGSVTGLGLAYLGQKVGASSADWHDSWQDQPVLPRAVRVELAEARFALPPIIVPIRQTTGTLCPTAEGGPACAAP